ncbi:hypothetical protein [Pantanalinema sp. GBBB05]|uniref:hypothetical protein n=1 Tax=Pantanalinema sp. GBBB05 TaxID=2604139 RepID=UPI003D8159D5
MPKITLLFLLGITIIAQSCSPSQPSISIPSTPVSTQYSPSQSVDSTLDHEAPVPRISEQIYQQAKQDHFSQDASKVPLLSVKLLNYLAQQNQKTLVCEGQTHQPFVKSYFPKVYTLSLQEYLVEQICLLGTYNIAYSYFLYRPHALIDKVEMSHQPSEAYRRDKEGYFALIDNANQLMKLTIPDGDVVPLTFEAYQLNESGKPVRYTSYLVGGRRLYNAKTRILSIFGKGRGLADCGSFAHYQLKKDRFQLLEYRSQKCCSSEQECNAPSYGRYPEEYPRIYP